MRLGTRRGSARVQKSATVTDTSSMVGFEQDDRQDMVEERDIQWLHYYH